MVDFEVEGADVVEFEGGHVELGVVGVAHDLFGDDASDGVGEGDGDFELEV